MLTREERNALVARLRALTDNLEAVTRELNQLAGYGEETESAKP